LDQEHHQERNDGRSRIDDQLPGIGKMKCWTGEKPDQDHEHGSSKSPSAAKKGGRSAREDAKGVVSLRKTSLALFRALLAVRFGHDSPLSSYLRVNPGKRAHGRCRSSEAVGRSSPGLIFPPI
jgi:hypothetical protein